MEKCFPITERIISHEHYCDHQWTLHQEIGTDGTYGEIWSVCCKDNCNYVMKYMPYNDDIRTNTREDILNEINVQNLCAEAGLCPVIHEAWLCESGGAFVMKIYRPSADLKSPLGSSNPLVMTVAQLLSKYEDKNLILDNILVLIDRLHRYGIYHGDLHLDNIMVKPTKENINHEVYSDEDWEYKFIDFGKGGTFQSMDNDHIEEDYAAIKDHLHDLMDEHPDTGFKELFKRMKVQMKKFA